MTRIKHNTPVELVLSFLNDAYYLTLRGFRSESTIRTVFWKSMITHTIADSDSLTPEILIKKFLHTFINVPASMEALDTRFDKMSRLFWEQNQGDLVDYFLVRTAIYEKTLKEVSKLINQQSSRYNNINNKLFILDDIHSEGVRSGQSISEIILSEYPSKLIISLDPVTAILLNDAIPDGPIKRLHHKMMRVCRSHLAELIYHKYFQPFEDNPHLPFLKIK